MNYAVFDALLNHVGSNNHTASKPNSYNEIVKYYDFQQVYQSLVKQKEGWWA